MLLVGSTLLCAFMSSCEPSTLFGSHKVTKTQRFSQSRHPELVSGSILPKKPPVAGDKWTLKQVQGDALGFDSDDAALEGRPSQILPTCGEVATHGVDGGGWQFTRGGMRALTPPSTTLCVVPLPVNGED